MSEQENNPMNFRDQIDEELINEIPRAALQMLELYEKKKQEEINDLEKKQQQEIGTRQQEINAMQEQSSFQSQSLKKWRIGWVVLFSLFAVAIGTLGLVACENRTHTSEIGNLESIIATRDIEISQAITQTTRIANEKATAVMLVTRQADESKQEADEAQAIINQQNADLEALEAQATADISEIQATATTQVGKISAAATAEFEAQQPLRHICDPNIFEDVNTFEISLDEAVSKFNFTFNQAELENLANRYVVPTWIINDPNIHLGRGDQVIDIIAFDDGSDSIFEDFKNHPTNIERNIYNDGVFITNVLRTLSVYIPIPEEPGDHFACFRMKDENGKFGPLLPLTIKITE